MERASSPQLRKDLEAAKALADTGIGFVPMPVFDDEDRNLLVGQLMFRLGRIEADI